MLAVSQAFAAAVWPGCRARPRASSCAELDGGAWQQPALRQRMEAVLRNPATTFDDYIFNAEFPEAGHRELLVYGRCIVSTGALSSKLLLGIKDVTPAAKRFSVFKNKFIYVFNASGRVALLRYLVQCQVVTSFR